jgi:hypothetical protein
VKRAPPASRRRQSGAALFLALVLLFVMAWLALSAFRISRQQLQIVGNSQADQQALASAQRAIDLTISSNEFSRNPAGVARVPVATDVDGNGKADYTARLDPQPRCVRVRPIKTMELDITKAGDRVCLQSASTGGNLVVAPSEVVAAGDSLCANSEWNVAAAVDDPVSGSTITVNQGVAVRIVASDAKNYCK